MQNQLDSKNPTKILVVDDDTVCTEVISLSLKNSGYSVSVAHDSTPLRGRQSSRFDVIVLDLWLSDSYGIESLELLSESEFKGKLILMSGLEESVIREVMHHAISIGLKLIGAITKPVSAEDIIRACRYS